jgi:hypothetical protein
MRRLRALALATLQGATSASAQEPTFGAVLQQSSANYLELSSVRSAENGVVEIYSLPNDTQLGQLLGSQEVTRGTSTDLRISLVEPPTTDVVALLMVGGKIVATQVIGRRFLN